MIIYLIIFFLFIYWCKKNKLELYKSINNKPIIWQYWENKPGIKKPPSYINLCFKTVKKHCKNNFDIIILDEKTVYNYLPDLRSDLDQLLIPQKTDYIRIKLLYTYGGIWLDADTIVMSNLKPIINKLNKYDFIGFGCTGHKCFNGYPRPSNQAMASRKNGLLCKNILENVDKKLDIKKENYSYFSLGKKIIWVELRRLQRNRDYKYYHYDSSYDGSRLKTGRWVSEKYYLNKEVELVDESKLFFIFLTNTFMIKDKKYKEFFKMSEKEILEQEYWISQMFRKSLL